MPVINPHFDIPFRLGAGSGIPFATNLVLNGGFETNLSGGWTVNGSPAPTAARVTTDAAFGTCCMSVTSTAASSGGWLLFPVFGGSPIPRIPYTMSAYVKGVGAAIGITFGMFVNESGGLISDQGMSSTYVSLTNAWQRVVGIGTPAQADRTMIYSYGMITATAAGQVFLTDAVQFEKGSAATPYIETNGKTASREANSNFSVVEQGSFEEIANCVEVIVRTPLGFRSDIPEFGFPELEFDVQPTTGPDIAEMVAAQEPRAQVIVSDRPDAFDVLINRVLVDVRGTTQVP